MGCDFSVVIPLYNKRAEIARCLYSVQAQTLKNFEVIIINDGSQDDGPAIAASVCESDDRIRLYHQTNQGIAAAGNKGVSLARAERIAFLDADDEWLPAHLALLASLSKRNPEAGMLFTSFWIDRGNGWRRRVSIPRRFLDRQNRMVSDYFRLPGDRILPSGTMVCKEAIEAVGLYRPMFGEDIDLLLRIVAAYPVVYSPTPTSVWHVDAGNRLCIQQEQRVDLHVPGSLAESLAQIMVDTNIPLTTKQRATSYVAKREKKAVVNTLLANKRTHALYLYDWWQKQFRCHSTLIEILLRCPRMVLHLIAKAREWMRRVSAAGAYLRDLPPTLLLSIVAKTH